LKEEKTGNTTSGILQMIHISHLLFLQCVYFVLGMGFHITNAVVTALGEKGLSPNDPLTGIAFMVVYAILLVPGFLRQIANYRYMMILAILLFFYGGIYLHVQNFQQEILDLYFSTGVWAVIFGINSFGLLLNLIAAIGCFRE
jgi:hypothetical protein